MESSADATRRFEALLDRSERLRASALPFDDLGEIGRLYRRHLAALARLRERSLDVAAIAYLNGLCVRAHTLLYAHAPSSRPADPLVRRAVPAALARTWRVQVLAWELLFAGMLVGSALVARDPHAMRQLVPACMCGSPDRLDALVRSRAARQEYLERRPTPAGLNVAFGSMLFSHNTRVGLLAFATGILAAVPTVLLQLYNGIVVGAFAGVFFRDPWPVDFLAWILPHGIPELTAVNLCAAGGLLVGGAVASPGRRPRSVAIRDAIGPAMLLVVAAVPLFALAALTESFVRESTLGTAARLAVAGAYAAILLAGSLWVRRLSRRPDANTGWLAELMPPRIAAARDSG